MRTLNVQDTAQAREILHWIRMLRDAYIRTQDHLSYTLLQRALDDLTTYFGKIDIAKAFKEPA